MSWRDEAPPLLVEIAEHARAVLAEELGIAPEVAEHGGYLVMRRIAERIGGACVYLPKADSLARHDRDLRIWAEFDGRNHGALARRYAVSTIHVYRLVKRMRAQALRGAQRELPGLGGGAGRNAR